MAKGMSVAAKTEQDPESCYETPEWLVERIRRAFGGQIDLDPCTTAQNPVGATKFVCPPDDGIAYQWANHGARIFCNPPYGRTISHWTQKAKDAAHDGASVILLVPARTDSAWFQDLVVKASAVLFIKGRLTFRGQKTGAPFPSALVGLNHHLLDLADLGWLVRQPGFAIYTNGQDLFAEPDHG